MATAGRVGTSPAHVPGEWTVGVLESLPDDGRRFGVVDGTLLASPTPRRRHRRMLSESAVLVRTACRPELDTFVAPLGWQPEQRTSPEPDVLVIRRDRVGENAIGDPELVVEVPELVDGESRQAAIVAGDEPLAVQESVSVTVIPPSLVAG